MECRGWLAEFCRGHTLTATIDGWFRFTTGEFHLKVALNGVIGMSTHGFDLSANQLVLVIDKTIAVETSMIPFNYSDANTTCTAATGYDYGHGSPTPDPTPAPQCVDDEQCIQNAKYNNMYSHCYQGRTSDYCTEYPEQYNKCCPVTCGTCDSWELNYGGGGDGLGKSCTYWVKGYGDVTKNCDSSQTCIPGDGATLTVGVDIGCVDSATSLLQIAAPSPPATGASCGALTALKSDQCCDKTSKTIRIGKTMMSHRWCESPAPAAAPVAAPATAPSQTPAPTEATRVCSWGSLLIPIFGKTSSFLLGRLRKEPRTCTC
jgi:hypothetical protein